MLKAGGTDRARPATAKPTAPILRTSLRFHSDMHSPSLILVNRSCNTQYALPIRGARNFYNLYNPSLQSVELLHSTAFVSEPREQQQRGGLGFLPETASVRESE